LATWQLLLAKPTDDAITISSDIQKTPRPKSKPKQKGKKKKVMLKESATTVPYSMQTPKELPSYNPVIPNGLMTEIT